MRMFVQHHPCASLESHGGYSENCQPRCHKNLKIQNCTVEQRPEQNIDNFINLEGTLILFEAILCLDFRIDLLNI